jgi:hypothetical protein
MKTNQWTMALAALGIISAPAAGLAEEKMNSVWTALSSTTISGYVDTSGIWNVGNGNDVVPGYAFNTPQMQDGFNLDVLKLSIAKPLDESQWAAGYQVDLLFGPNATSLGTSIDSGGDSDGFAIQQAYVSLRTPVGNGLDFKVGVYNAPIGYESFDRTLDPNFTRSYGYTMEPTTMTGVLMSYQFSPLVSASASIANTYGPAINGRAWYSTPSNGAGNAQSFDGEGYLTYAGSVALTAPDSWGFLAGSTLYGTIINGFNANSQGSGLADNQTSYYVGATVNTPIKNVKAGASYDYAGSHGHGTTGGAAGTGSSAFANAVAGYLSWQATEKLSLHGRAEWATTDTGVFGPASTKNAAGQLNVNKIVALTGTIQYDLWKNVISRLEVRWDHLAGDNPVGYGGDAGNYTVSATDSSVSYAGGSGNRNALIFAFNVIYKF